MEFVLLISLFCGDIIFLVLDFFFFSSGRIVFLFRGGEMNEVVNLGVMNIVFLVVLVVVFFIGFILWFFINCVSLWINE